MLGTCRNIAILRCLTLGSAIAVLVACTLSPQSRDDDSSRQYPLEYLPGLGGDYFKHESQLVGRPFHIYVRLPEGYRENSESYPVVYVLDGDSLFPIVAPNHLFLTYDEDLPEAVIIGVAYGSFSPETNRRSYDFSSPTREADPDHGGASQFLGFLKNELLPKVESRYRIDPSRRVLFGQSRSGFMVLYTAFSEPDLFWGYICSNPAFDPGREKLFSPAASAMRKDLGLVITSGSRDYPVLREAALEWMTFWQNRDNAPWEIEAITIDGGTHASYSATSYRRGILWLFNRSSTSTQL